MKKIIIPLILILSLSGCKDYIEINDLAILTGIVIDYKDDMYEVTAQLIVNDKDSKIEVFKTSSSSINEAIAELSKLSNKEVFISHLKVLIVTDRIIKKHIAPPITLPIRFSLFSPIYFPISTVTPMESPETVKVIRFTILLPVETPEIPAVVPNHPTTRISTAPYMA